jgi:hypothetical protein
MKSRLGKPEILSHGSLFLRASQELLVKYLSQKPLVKSISGSIALSLIGGLIGGLVSCSSVPNPSDTSQVTPSPAIASSPSPNSPLFSSPHSQSPNSPSPDKVEANLPKSPEPAITKSPKSAPKNTVAINIYQVDSQCNDFIAERVNLPQSNSLEMAVAKVIEKSSINEFNLASSKVTTDPQTGMATVDFQVAANSKRRFISLSSCEQFNLFGSLRKTLIDNPNWQIKDVRFTEGGKELAL